MGAILGPCPHGTPSAPPVEPSATATHDPLPSPTPALPAPIAAAPSEPALLLVPAAGAGTLPAGASTLAYLADDDAYLVSATPSAQTALLRRPYGPAISPFPASRKLSPDLLPALSAASSPLRITAVAALPSDAPVLRDLLAAHGATDIRLSAASPRRTLATATLPADPAAAQAAISALAASPAVQWLQPAPVRILANDRAQADDRLATAAVKSRLGLSGAGQLVAVADTGLSTGDPDTLHPDLCGRLVSAVALQRTNDWSDSSQHGTHVAGTILGTGAASDGLYAGVAPAARLFFQSVADADGVLRGIPDDIYDLFLPEYDAGARVSSHSWGTALDSTYDVDALAADEFARDHPDFLLLFAAGNEAVTLSGGRFASRSIITPATAKNVLAVGASESGRLPGTGGRTSMTYAEAWDFADEPVASDLVDTPPPDSPAPQGLAAFSSRGPTSDHRVKPDLVAPGTDIISLRSPAPVTNKGVYVLSANTNYIFLSGTSMATPFAAGAALLLREHLAAAYACPAPAAALLRATLIGGARSLAPGQYPLGWPQELPDAPRPDNAQGWGQLDLLATIAPAPPLAALYLDAPPAPFQSADEPPHEYPLPVLSPDAPLTAALAYPDAPPALSSSRRIVNDLDLSLLSPDGTTYHPSLRPAPDHTNLVETIDIPAPHPTGTWTVAVTPHAIPVPPQTYSLYLRGPFAPLPADLDPAAALRHDPLPDTADDSAPYPITASFFPPFLATNRNLTLSYVADRPDSTTDAASLPMTTADRVTFAASIPPQPLGTRVTYTFSASDLPSTATSAFPVCTFCVVPPVTGAIAVTPDLLADAYPDLFPTAPIPLASGTLFRASAPLVLDDPDDPACRYLLASPSDTTTLVAVASAPLTTHTFAYVRQTSLLHLSSPPGILHTTTWHTVSSISVLPAAAPSAAPLVTRHSSLVTRASSVIPPLLATLNSTNYAFSGWTLDGTDLPAPASRPLTNLDLSAPRTLVARYLPADLDADTNHLSDAFELRHYGTLGQNPYADTDADGYPDALEDADGTDPLDPLSVPAPPTVTLEPITSPVTAPFPLLVRATAADNATLPAVTLSFRRTPALSVLRAAAPPAATSILRTIQMFPLSEETTVISQPTSALYAASIPLPAADADTFTLVATATDAAGLTTSSDPIEFTLSYPTLATTPDTTPIAIAAPHTSPPLAVTLLLANTGSAPFHLDASLLPVGYSNSATTADAPTDPTITPGSTWHIDTLESASPPSAWYNGYGAYSPTYPHSADASLLTPPIRTYPAPAVTSRLAFAHLADFELDTETPTIPPHYWDSGILQASADDGATWTDLVPDGGYPALVTSNTASPFPPDTPCLASTSDRWTTVTAPLPAPLPGTPLRIRFRFGSDSYETARGWFVDDILVTPRTAHAAPTNWCQLSAQALDIAPGAESPLVLTFAPSLVPPGETDYQILRLAHTDPSIPSPLLIPIQLTDTTIAVVTTSDGPGSLAPAYPPDAPLLLEPSDLPATLRITFAPKTNAILADLLLDDAPVPDLPEPIDAPPPYTLDLPADASNRHLHATFAPAPPPDAIPPADWFLAHGIDTNRPSAALAALDPDHDALRTWQEYQLGLDPLRPDAALILLTPPPLVTWHALTNESLTYVLQSTTNLLAAPFTNLYSLPAAPPLMTSPPLPPSPSPLFLRLSLP